MKAPEVVMPAVAAGAVPELIAPADDVAAFLPEVTARLELLRAAYLSAAGLTVPGMPQGLPLAEAEAKAAEITASIRSRRLELMGRLDENGVWQMPIEWPRPPLVDPGPAVAMAPIPSDAIVLFDGISLDEWTGVDNWTIADGVATVKDGSIKTKRAFGDCQVHVEFRMPRPGRMAVVRHSLHTAAVRPDGSLEAHGRVSVLHNGVAIHLDTVIKGTKPWHGPPMAVAHADALPITIQDHGSPVQFRSIWVRPFEPVLPRAIGGKQNAPSASETSSSQ